MRTGSEAALGRARDRWETLLRERPGQEIGFGKTIFSVADLLTQSSSLSAALQDNARSEEDRAQLARTVFDGKVPGEVTELIMGLARDRWSEKHDLARALDALGTETLLAAAQREGNLSAVEEELYQAQRTIHDSRDMRLFLNNRDYDLAARKEFIAKVFAEYLEVTRELLVRAVEKGEERPIVSTVRGYTEAAAARDEHLVASVTSAVPLTQAQEERLTSILTRTYGKDVAVHVSLNPDVIGGLRIHVGNDVIDGTLASRINGVREAFTN